jgi:hypothetical protein
VFLHRIFQGLFSDARNNAGLRELSIAFLLDDKLGVGLGDAALDFWACGSMADPSGSCHGRLLIGSTAIVKNWGYRPWICDEIKRC